MEGDLVDSSIFVNIKCDHCGCGNKYLLSSCTLDFNKHKNMEFKCFECDLFTAYKVKLNLEIEKIKLKEND